MRMSEKLSLDFLLSMPIDPNNSGDVFLKALVYIDGLLEDVYRLGRE